MDKQMMDPKQRLAPPPWGFADSLTPALRLCALGAVRHSLGGSQWKLE